MTVETPTPALDWARVVGGTLVERNPEAEALMWKVVVATDDAHRRSTQHRDEDEGWLHAALGQQPAPPAAPLVGTLAALRPSTHRCRLLSLFQAELQPPSGGGKAPAASFCCLAADAALIRREGGEASELREELKGTTGVVFLCTVRDDSAEEWAEHRQRLRLLLAAAPKSAGVPVLVLLCTDVWPRFVDAHVHARLGLDDSFFGGRVGAFLFHTVRETPTEETHADVRRCAGWLAANAPLQPTLREYELTDLVSDSVAAWQKRAAWEQQPVADPWLVLRTLNSSLDELGSRLDAADPTSIWWPAPEFEVLWNSGGTGTGCGPDEVPLPDWNAPALWSELRHATDVLLEGLRFPELQGGKQAPALPAPPVQQRSIFDKPGTTPSKPTGDERALVPLTPGSANFLAGIEDTPTQPADGAAAFAMELLGRLGYARARRRRHGGAGGERRERQAEEEDLERTTALGMPTGAEVVTLVESLAGGDDETVDWRALLESLHRWRLDWLAAAAVEQGLPALVLPRKKAELQTPRQPLLVGLPPPAPARARTWAQVASTGSAAPKRRLGDAEEGRAASPQEKRRKEDEQVLASLREAQDESAHYEDALAALLQS